MSQGIGTALGVEAIYGLNDRNFNNCLCKTQLKLGKLTTNKEQFIRLLAIRTCKSHVKTIAPVRPRCEGFIQKNVALTQ
jgi:hypothetical protein